MSTRYHVWKSEDDMPDDGGTYEHAKTFELKVNMLDFVSRLLNEGKAVQILPEEVSE